MNLIIEKKMQLLGIYLIDYFLYNLFYYILIYTELNNSKENYFINYNYKKL